VKSPDYVSHCAETRGSDILKLIVNRRAAIISRRSLAVISFVRCLPSLFLSVTLLRDFVRIYREQSYHFDYAYGTQFVLWASVASLLAGLAVYTFVRRSYYGLIPVFAIIVGLGTVHVTPDLVPPDRLQCGR